MAWLMNKRRSSPFREDWAKGKVYLYQFPRRPACIVTISSFCLKLETWLRIASIE